MLGMPSVPASREPPGQRGRRARPSPEATPQAGGPAAARLDMRAELPALVTCQQIQQQLGLTRSAAYRLMRQLETIRFPGSRRVYVRRDDVHQLIEEATTR